MNKNEIIAILKNYKAQFAVQYGITAIGLFGSVARGQNRDDSDVWPISPKVTEESH